MPLYRTGGDRFQKYQKKYNPTVIGQRFTDVQEVALARAQEGLIVMATIDQLVGPVLDQYGITGPGRALYLAFAKKLARHMLRHKGEAGKKLAQGLKSYWVTAFGADPAVLDEIINIVAGWVAAY
jgi:hypothetical protein